MDNTIINYPPQRHSKLAIPVTPPTDKHLERSVKPDLELLELASFHSILSINISDNVFIPLCCSFKPTPDSKLKSSTTDRLLNTKPLSLQESETVELATKRASFLK
jgi:hypothetical protein